jgi:hypothetical protein
MARGARAAIALLALAFAAPAAAATPQDIYRDLADNGRLDRHYSRADINRALHSPSLRRYEPLRRPETAVTPTPVVPPAVTQRALPFSCLDLALLGGVGGPLLLFGASLGRFARVRHQQELS